MVVGNTFLESEFEFIFGFCFPLSSTKNTHFDFHSKWKVLYQKILHQKIKIVPTSDINERYPTKFSRAESLPLLLSIQLHTTKNFVKFSCMRLPMGLNFPPKFYLQSGLLVSPFYLIYKKVYEEIRLRGRQFLFPILEVVIFHDKKNAIFGS